MKQSNFAENLIKGRIAEVVFEQMLREAGAFTVLPFGYEYVVPEVAQMKKDVESEEAMEILRTSPDFVVINHKSNKVHLIEVKYQKTYDAYRVKKKAKRMQDSWDPSYLFLATPERFYFNSAKTIIEKDGVMEPLEHPNVSEELQEKYLDILNRFEGDRK
jgi:hypothetical protein